MIDLIDFMHADSSSSDTIARDRPFFAKWTLFAHRSLLLHCTSRETDGGTTDRVIDAFAPFEGLALRYIEDDRSFIFWSGGLAAKPPPA